MGKIAFVFSGQGSQYCGMGQSIYEFSPAARAVFDKFDKMRHNTISQCFYGDIKTLSMTINTQPCLYALEMAICAALDEANITANMVAGFSLGEIAALSYGGVFSLEKGFEFVCQRASSMHKAAEKLFTSMAAVLKLSNTTVEELCADFDSVYPVNYNCEGQVVVAGENEQLNKFCKAVLQKGGRALLLPVSGGFHSPFMDSAAKKLCEILEDFPLKSPQIPIYSNVTALPYEDDTKGLISKQVNNPVLWQKTIENMIADGADIFIEVGTGKTLTKLINKINPTVTAFNVEDKGSLLFALQQLNKGENLC